MTTRFTIPCELCITPGSSTTQNRFRLSANGETVFDDYEQSLSKAQLAICREIAAAHSRLLTKWAQEPNR